MYCEGRGSQTAVACEMDLGGNCVCMRAALNVFARFFYVRMIVRGLYLCSKSVHQVVNHKSIRGFAAVRKWEKQRAASGSWRNHPDALPCQGRPSREQR